jgi:adenylate cyclase, class 2
MAKNAVETEIKLRAPGAAEGRALLERNRFAVTTPRVFEANTIVDTADQSLRRSGELLRLREAGGKFTLTFKGPGQPGPHKSREELELQLSDIEAARLIFDRLGYLPTFRYEKYRTEFSRPGEDGVATLDETPAGTFLELEGPASWIDATARELGYSPSDYITLSYASVYREYCERLGIEPTNMVF